MSNTITIAIVVILLAIVVLAFVMRAASRGAKAKTDADAVPHEGDGVADSAAAAIEDVLGEFLKVDAHPGEPDALTTIKGLGPKAATQLGTIGITRFAQLGALSEVEIAAVDAKMGVFRGRIRKDQWVEQARLLAAGDTAAFEATYGKLG